MTSTVTANFQDRAVYAQRLADFSRGQKTAEDVTAELEKMDRDRLNGAETAEAFYSGNLSPAQGSKPETYEKVMADARAARSQHYSLGRELINRVELSALA